MDKYSSKSYKVFLSSIRIGNFIILSKDIKVLISVLSLLIPLLRSWGWWMDVCFVIRLYLLEIFNCEKIKVLNTSHVGNLLPCFYVITWYWEKVICLSKTNDVSIGRQEEGSGIASSEVKFSDRGKTNRCESGKTHHTSVNQERKLGDRRWLDTIVVLTVNNNDKRLARNPFTRSPQNLKETLSFWFPGEVWSQGWNLKELTEEHHQEWSLRLNSTQHGKSHQVRISVGMTKWSFFMIW